MGRKLFKIMVMVLGILLANLLTIWIDEYMLTYRWSYSPHLFTAIGMGVVLLIYYPLFSKIDQWATKAGNKFMRTGKKVVGREVGAFVFFFLALVILYFLYGLEWFDTNVIVSFFRSL